MSTFSGKSPVRVQVNHELDSLTIQSGDLPIPGRKVIRTDGQTGTIHDLTPHHVSIRWDAKHLGTRAYNKVEFRDII